MRAGGPHPREPGSGEDCPRHPRNPQAMRPIIDPAASDWLNGRQAGAIIGCSPTALHRAGMLGYIRVKLDPGEPPRYFRPDVERVAASKREAATAGA